MNFFIELQKNISKLVELKNVGKFDVILASDVGYLKNIGKAVAVLYDLNENKVIKTFSLKKKIIFPYVAGLLFLREGPIIFDLIKKVKDDYDLIIVDGHGLAHPRKAGIATFIGILTKKPCIGIAKSFLFGEIKNNYIFVDGERVGVKFKKYYASIGSNINIESLEKFLEKINFEYPEALKIADKLSKS